jgi:phosphatidylinositol glycan class N
LDEWVFDKVFALFDAAEHDTALAQRMRGERVVFFLHLLGIDTYGHAKRPMSREYLRQLTFIDDGIRRVVRRAQQFYDDDRRSAFVFTSDHGMSDKGFVVVCWLMLC